MSPRQLDRTITVPRPLGEAPFTCGHPDLAAARKEQSLRPLDYLIAGVLLVGAAAFAYDIHSLAQLLRALVAAH